MEAAAGVRSLKGGGQPSPPLTGVYGETAGGRAELTDFGVRFLAVSFSKFPALTGDADDHPSGVGEGLVQHPLC